MCKTVGRPVPGGGPKCPGTGRGGPCTRACSHRVHGRVRTSRPARDGSHRAGGREPGRGSRAEGRQGNSEQRTRRGGGP